MLFEQVLLYKLVAHIQFCIYIQFYILTHIEKEFHKTKQKIYLSRMNYIVKKTYIEHRKNNLNTENIKNLEVSGNIKII